MDTDNGSKITDQVVHNALKDVLYLMVLEQGVAKTRHFVSQSPIMVSILTPILNEIAKPLDDLSQRNASFIPPIAKTKAFRQS